MAETVQRIEHEDDPRRCQALIRGGKGQCQCIKIEGSEYCIMHGGQCVAKAVEKENKRMYQLAKWNARIGEFAEHPNIKSLRDELGILRMVLEEKLRMCGDAHTLILSSGPISELVMKIEKIVKSCHRLDSSLHELLDKTAILHLGGEIVEIIGRHVKDDQIVDSIATEIGEAIARAGKSFNDESLGESEA
jgi:hypothetical protein